MILWVAIGSVEVCVLLLVAAAAVVALSSRPRKLVQAEDYYVAGTLVEGDDAGVPTVSVESRDDGIVTVVRHGFDGGVTAGGAVSLAVRICGDEVTVTERVVAGQGRPVAAAVFSLDFFRTGRLLAMTYEAPAFSRHARCTVHVGSGHSVTLPLAQ